MDANSYRFIAVTLVLAVCLAVPLYGGQILIYGPSVQNFGSVSPEEQLAVAAGHTVTVLDATTWGAMTTAQFASFNAIVFGDPNCTTGTFLLAAANANKAVWSAAISGPKVISGTDPRFHYVMFQAEAGVLITNGINFAASGSGTGLYVTLSCYYELATSPTTVDFLSAIGNFQVVGAGLEECSDAVSVLEPSHPVMAGLSSATLSNWDCSMHERFASFPTDYTVLALAGVGTPAHPYIIATTSTPKIEITLVPQPSGNRYEIDESPMMPMIQAKARVINVSLDPTPNTTFTWTVQLRFTTCSTEFNYDNQIQQNGTTLGEALFTLTFLDASAFRGGSLKLIATATVNGQQLTDETPSDLRIEGTNPQRSSIQGHIDSLVPTGYRGLEVPDIQDALKRMACQESSQRQFDATANGGIGPPLVNCLGRIGGGVFQITPELPSILFRDEPNVGFNWRTNDERGVTLFRDEKVPPAHDYPRRVRTNSNYRTAIAGINANRMSRGLSPIPGNPAPSFTTDGPITGVPIPSNQLLEDSVRGFNGFNGSDAYGLPLHEFAIDEDFLRNVPDSELPGLSNNPRVWKRVVRMPGPGDFDYVNHVIAQSPQCAP